MRTISLLHSHCMVCMRPFQNDDEDSGPASASLSCVIKAKIADVCIWIMAALLVMCAILLMVALHFNRHGDIGTWYSVAKVMSWPLTQLTACMGSLALKPSPSHVSLFAHPLPCSLPVVDLCYVSRYQRTSSKSTKSTKFRTQKDSFVQCGPTWCQLTASGPSWGQPGHP